jgi:hypothetical protein
MAIDPYSINPKDIKKLVVEGMVFQPDGGMKVERVKTSDDPVVAEREMKALADTAKAWRSVHDFTANLSDEEFAKRKEEAMRLRNEMLAMSAAPQPAFVPTSSVATAAPGVIVPVRPATLEKAYEGYIDSKANIAKSTKDAYEASYELFATLMGGKDRLIHEITQVEFMEFNDAGSVRISVCRAGK